MEINENQYKKLVEQRDLIVLMIDKLLRNINDKRYVADSLVEDPQYIKWFYEDVAKIHA